LAAGFAFTGVGLAATLRTGASSSDDEPESESFSAAEKAYQDMWIAANGHRG
jgi:hypothetical protein